MRRAATVLLLLVLAGCADQSASPTPTATQEATAPTATTAATPGSSASSSDAAAGSTVDFQLLGSAPADQRSVTGHVTLSGDRRTFTVTLSGLTAGAAYMGHVHSQSCAQDAGGPHFRFDPAGAASPPNEVHFMLDAGSNGAGSAQVEAAQPLPDGARAVVLHTHDGTKIACADLPPTG
jgi:hypothetical protein